MKVKAFIESFRSNFVQLEAYILLITCGFFGIKDFCQITKVINTQEFSLKLPEGGA